MFTLVSYELLPDSPSLLAEPPRVGLYNNCTVAFETALHLAIPNDKAFEDTSELTDLRAQRICHGEIQTECEV